MDQGIVAGCSGGTFDSLCQVADILDGESVGNGAFTMSVYPGSQPVYLELLRNGAAAKIMASGALLRECFCGPCFGAGDTPANGEFSNRHTTRNFPNREGSKPGEGQLAGVALMDAPLGGGHCHSRRQADARHTAGKGLPDPPLSFRRQHL